jgi:hypothetical protein
VEGEEMKTTVLSIVFNILLVIFCANMYNKANLAEERHDKLKREYEETAQELTAIQYENMAVSAESRDAQKQLESYKNREDVVLRRPGLVELKVNKAFLKEQQRLECFTGGSCGN